TSDGTATAPSDYAAKTGTVTFDPGQTSKAINILVHGDTTIEPDETLLVTLSNPTNAVIASGAGVATGTIVNDDQPAISVNNATFMVPPDTSAHLTISLSAAGLQPVTVHFATASDTAVAG